MNTGSPSLMDPSQSGAICTPKNGEFPCLGSLSGGNLVLRNQAVSKNHRTQQIIVTDVFAS